MSLHNSLKDTPPHSCGTKPTACLVIASSDSDEAIHRSACCAMDCCASLAMPGNGGGPHTTTVSRFAARVIPVYSHRARDSWNAKLSSNSTTSSHCEPCDL